MKASTHHLSEKDRTQAAHTAKQGRFGWGAITTLGAFRTFTNIPGRGIRTASFAAFGSWSGVLPKNAESLRDSDALMRVAVPRRRGPAGLRDLFTFCRSCGLYTLRSELSVRARQGWYHYPRRAPHVLETLDGRLSKAANLPFSEVGWSSLIPVAQKQKQHLTANSPDPCERNRSCFLRHFMERARNAAICALVQVELGSKRPLPTPVVIPPSTAQATACA